MTTTPDAVDTLECAILEATDGYAKGAARAVADYLELEGFTITRQPAMTEAELEREARNLCTAQNIYWDNSHPTTHYMTEAAAIQLAKKYRGTL